SATNASTPQAVTITVNDLDEVAPTITSGSTASNLIENSPVSTVVYTATADDSSDISGGLTWSISGPDAALLDINSSTGEVTLKAEADYESKSSYNFDVVATDTALNSDSQSVTLNIDDVASEPVEVVFAYNSSTALVNNDGDTNFDAGSTYEITIIVPSDSWQLWTTTFDQWSGASNLGSDDKITLIGADGYIQDNTSGSLSVGNMQRDMSSTALRWAGSTADAIVLSADGVLTRYSSSGGTNTIDLWSDSMTNLPQLDIQTDIPAEWGFVA
ncbi:cadherin repeat domain-containing protein, partial [Vibrio sp. 10N.261.45.A1]